MRLNYRARRRGAATSGTPCERMPAASSAIGSVLVSVIPGHVDFQEIDLAGLADDQVGPGDVAQAKRGVRARRAFAAASSASSAAGPYVKRGLAAVYRAV